MTELTTPKPSPPADAGDEPGPSALARARRYVADRPRGELYAWIALIAGAFVLRIFDLGSRPFHHDESQDAYFSWVFFDQGEYAYDPLLHGPLRFYLTGLMYVLFGDSDFTARLAPALMGTVAVGLPYLIRRQIGGLAAFAAGVLLAVGPSYLYFSRFAREDIYVAAITLGLVVATFRYLDRPGRVGPSVILGLVALSFATKETTFISLAVAGAFFIPLTIAQSVRAARAGGSWRDGEIVRKVSAHGWVPWAYGFATFLLIFAVLFTVFLTNPGGFVDGITDGISYWLAQQPVGRGGESPWLYPAILFGDEWPVLLFGAVGAIWVVRHPTTMRLFLIWAFVGSLAIYMWASERFAWLVLHPLLPLILLAGIGVQAAWRARRRALRVAGVTAAVAGLAYALYATYTVNAKYGADPRELLVSTQSSVDVKRVADRVHDIDQRVRARTGSGVTITIDSGQGATFPYAWYFRHLRVGYIDMTTPNYVPEAQVLIMTEQARTAQLPNLAAYDGQQFRFRVWWVRDWSEATKPGNWWDWFVRREPFNETGGMSEWIYVRKDAEAS